MSDKNSLTQRDQTRNQSTADIKHENIFLFYNDYEQATFSNSGADELDLIPGSFIMRDTTNPTQVIPLTSARMADVIGIVSAERVTVAAGGTAEITYCKSGEVDSELLTFPADVTLDTVPTGGGKSFRDILAAIGIDLSEVTNHTKLDN